MTGHQFNIYLLYNIVSYWVNKCVACSTGTLKGTTDATMVSVHGTLPHCMCGHFFKVTQFRGLLIKVVEYPSPDA